MAKSKRKQTCHNCLNDFEQGIMLYVTISTRSPHTIILCPKCENKETRKVPGVEVIPYTHKK